MYDLYYELKGDPFRLSPDHTMAFEHQRFGKARAYMAYAFMRAEGFVMITGRPGTGKTTLVGALVEHLAGQRVVTAKLVCTQVQADDLLKLVAYEYGISTGIADKGALIQQLGSRFKAWDREGRRILLIVDEAQDLSVSALEELRLLTNIEVQGRPLLQIFLLGQPELKELIMRPELEQVHQRLVAATHLEPLAEEETESYIRHRLGVVGWRDNPLISKAVFPLIYRFSEGIPRRINLICSRLFLHCAVEQRDRIAALDVKTVVEELQSESLAAGSPFTERDFDVVDEYDDEPETEFLDTAGDPADSPLASDLSKDRDGEAGPGRDLAGDHGGTTSRQAPVEATDVPEGEPLETGDSSPPDDTSSESGGEDARLVNTEGDASSRLQSAERQSLDRQAVRLRIVAGQAVAAAPVSENFTEFSRADSESDADGGLTAEVAGGSRVMRSATATGLDEARGHEQEENSDAANAPGGQPEDSASMVAEGSLPQAPQEGSGRLWSPGVELATPAASRPAEGDKAQRDAAGVAVVRPQVSDRPTLRRRRSRRRAKRVAMALILLLLGGALLVWAATGFDVQF